MRNAGKFLQVEKIFERGVCQFYYEELSTPTFWFGNLLSFTSTRGGEVKKIGEHDSTVAS